MPKITLIPGDRLWIEFSPAPSEVSKHALTIDYEENGRIEVARFNAAEGTHKPLVRFKATPPPAPELDALGQLFADIFGAKGAQVFTVDESGVHPIQPTPPKKEQN